MATFSYVNPDATTVYLAGEMNNWSSQDTPMQKGQDGSWSVALKLAPGQWVYKFVVDGKYIADPDMQSLSSSDGQGGKHSSRLVSDGDFQYHATIPHGILKPMSFLSHSLQETAEINVYIPPVKTTEGLPVMLLLHGSGMDRQQWADNGLITNYMDNFIAQNTIKPFIVAMPSYMPFISKDKFLDYFAQDLPRFLKDNFGTSCQPKHMVLAGMSLGGWVTLRLGSLYPDHFGILIPISAYYPIPISNKAEVAHLQKAMRLIFYCGTEDHLFLNNEVLTKYLRDSGGLFQYHKTQGGHTWRYWNAITPDFLKKASDFFQEK
ncbi:MAG: hypothetical protein HUU50_21140 [Candidatus Brocadiae bacterium]|nr:hypothetical protein [Candidatus Brocadiia bacterium]